MVVLYIILFIIGIVALYFLLLLLAALGLAVFSVFSHEIFNYWYAIIPLSLFLTIITPWYISLPGIWFTLSFLKNKEDSSVKNPLI